MVGKPGTDPLFPSAEPEDGRGNVKSLFKMVEVLEAFTGGAGELSVVEIARATGLPRTTVHRIVDSLRHVGFLEQEASRERYRLGLKLFQLGNAAINNLPLYREAQPFTDTLSRLSNQVVHLCVFDGKQMVFISRAEHTQGGPLNSVTTIEASPCHSTGVGKVTLAHQDEATIERIIAHGLPRLTPATITAPDRLRQELAEIRRRGYAVDNGEHETGRRCVAAPICNAAGRVFAAISVSGHERRIPLSHVPEMAVLVRSHAEQISARLGFRRTAPDGALAEAATGFR